MGVARRANIKNQQLTIASTFHYVEAVALYIYFPQERRTPLQALWLQSLLKWQT